MAKSDGGTARIAAVRRFNRFYTQRIGVLGERLHDSPYSLTEARLMYELALRGDTTLSELAAALGLDRGYLSRTLKRFEQGGLLCRAPSAKDGRRVMLALSDAGRAAFVPLEGAAKDAVAAMIAPLPPHAQDELVTAMASVERLLAGPVSPVVVRPPGPGDIGWVIARHGALYAKEYGFDSRFEALVAKVAGDFLANHDPAREACWIAARGDINLGSVFLVREDDSCARLRLLIVEPAARGQGIAGTLVERALSFAQDASYRRVVLWTQKELGAARHLYRHAGFRLVRSKPHTLFGPPMTGEDWEKALE